MHLKMDMETVENYLDKQMLSYFLDKKREHKKLARGREKKCGSGLCTMIRNSITRIAFSRH
jgi:hypothetical protein